MSSVGQREGGLCPSCGTGVDTSREDCAWCGAKLSAAPRHPTDQIFGGLEVTPEMIRKRDAGNAVPGEFRRAATPPDYIPSASPTKPGRPLLQHWSKKSSKVTPLRLVAWLIVLVGVFVAPAIAINAARAFQSTPHISTGR